MCKWYFDDWKLESDQIVTNKPKLKYILTYLNPKQTQNMKITKNKINFNI